MNDIALYCGSPPNCDRCGGESAALSIKLPKYGHRGFCELCVKMLLEAALAAEKIPTQFTVTLKPSFNAEDALKGGIGLQQLMELNMLIGQCADHSEMVNGRLNLTYKFPDCRGIINTVCGMNFDFVESVQY